jgi:hypothetical protein
MGCDRVTLICHRQDLPTLERMFTRLRTRIGLFVVGAGASAGSSPHGRDFWRESPLDYLRDLRSFPAIVTPRTPLTQRMIDYSGIEIGDIFPGRELRSGTDEYPFREILKRLPDGFAREQLKHVLGRARYFARTEGTITNSYRVFRAFHPSVIADYNHDGLAQQFCGAKHAIVEMHGTIHPGYGSPEFGAWISGLREFHIALPPDDLVMGLPESWTDGRLYRRLSWVLSKAPQHVAIIGYSFAQMGSGYDDAVTLACFVRRFKDYHGPIFVVSPDPTQLCEMLSDALEIKTVYPVKRFWNVLAHAYLEALRDPDKFRSLDHAHWLLYDRHGGGKAFPIPTRWV